MVFQATDTNDQMRAVSPAAEDYRLNQFRSDWEFGSENLDDVDSQWDLVAQQLGNAMRRGNEEDKQEYNKSPWKINEEGDFVKNLKVPWAEEYRKETGKEPTSKVWVKDVLGLDENKLQAFLLEAGIAGPASIAAAAAGTKAGVATQALGLPTPVAIGTGLVTGLGTYALGDAALREAISTGYDYLFPDNAGTLSTDLYKDYTPEAAAFGKGGQLFGSFGGFQGYLSRLLRKKTPEDVNFGNADLGLRIDSLKRQYGIGEPGLSFGRFTHQGPQDLGVWQNAILNKKLSALEAKKGFTNVTEAITRDLIERYNANPGMFNLVETLAGAGAAGGAIVSEQLYPGETLPALGFETAGAIFTPATTLGRIVSATSPYLRSTFDFVTTPSDIIPKTEESYLKKRVAIQIRSLTLKRLLNS